MKCSWYYFIDGLVYYSKGDLNRARSQLSMAKKEIPKAEQWLEEVRYFVIVNNVDLFNHKKVQFTDSKDIEKKRVP